MKWIILVVFLLAAAWLVGNRYPVLRKWMLAAGAAIVAGALALLESAQGFLGGL